MEISPSQQEVLVQLQTAIESMACREFVYCSEWLGYFPFGAYQWVEIDGADISTNFPNGWLGSDLTALEQAGYLRLLSTWQNPKDEHHKKITYALS